MLWRFGVRDWIWMVYQAEYGLEFVFLGALLAVLGIRLPRRPQVRFLILAIVIYGLTPLPAIIDDWLRQEVVLRYNTASPAMRVARLASPWVNPCLALALFAAVWWCLIRAVFGSSGVLPPDPPAQETSDVADPSRLVS